MSSSMDPQRKAEIYEIVYKALEDFHFNQVSDVEREMRFQARADTARWIRENIPLHQSTVDRFDLLNQAMDAIQVDGFCLEFGVWKGRSLQLLAERFPDKRVFGFDSFEGVPDPWIFKKKAFHDLPQMPVLPENVELVIGWFDDTLAGFLAEHPGPCAFVNIDSDVYSSAKTVLEQLEPRIVPGTVIVFDEFYNYPGWRDGEFKAWNEYVERAKIEFEYIAFSGRSVREEVRVAQGTPGHQVVLRVTGIGG